MAAWVTSHAPEWTELIVEPEQRSKALLDPAVWRGGDQKNLPIRIACEFAEQLVTLMLGAGGCSAWTRRCVCLVDDYKIRGMSEKPIALRFRLREIDRATG